MTLYGFFHNSCIYESAAGLVSLHQSKRSAYRAMRTALYAAAVEERECYLLDGYKFDTLGHQAFYVAPIEVQP